MKILISAGDVSGDIHSAEVARRIRSLHPDWQIDAIGGEHLRDAGANIIGDSSGFGVIGVTSAWAVVPRALLLQRRIFRYLQSERPDAVVLCDWGAFNTRLFSRLKKYRIPILYYFPPRSWQKTGTGGLGIAPFVDRVATPFAWSAQRLREAGCKAEWVGHPLLETIQRNKEALAKERDKNLIALLPGSRKMEWKWIAPKIADAARIIRNQKPEARFVAVVPRGASQHVQKYFSGICEVSEGSATKVLLQSQAAIVKSGTVTLEAAVCDTPQVVVYDVPPLLRAQWVLTGLGKKVPFVAMPNIIAGREIITELIGLRCRATLIAEEVLLLMDDANHRAKMKEDYAEVRRALGSELPFSATERTVQMLEEMLEDLRG
jgi:lipid-A-disaccharide synthase